MHIECCERGDHPIGDCDYSPEETARLADEITVEDIADTDPEAPF